MSAALPKYPVYVISKGRASNGLTAKHLRKDGVPFSLVVEPQERDDYLKHGAREEELIVTPFSNLGQASIPVRNFVWEHALALGTARHWVLDDNIRGLRRRWKTRRIGCDFGLALHAMETFVDRYKNVGIAGPNYDMFAPNLQPMAPYFLNTHVYSAMLIRNDLPYRWRGRHNEDVDLCLQVLTGGLCTILFNAFLQVKMPTMKMKGGNTSEVYSQSDSRLKATRALERAWPGIVTLKRRFSRPQHMVKGSWAWFDTPLQRRDDIDFTTFQPVDEFGMQLTQHAEPKSPKVRALVAGHARTVKQ